MTAIPESMSCLTNLARGRLSLRVPILDGSVQVGRNHVKKEMLHPLSIQIESGSINIRREDGQPINVASVHEDWDTGEIETAQLLPEPVPEIDLVCLDPEKHAWGTGELEIDEDKLEILADFAYTLAAHALRKQRKSSYPLP